MNFGKLGQAVTAREIFDLIHDDLEQVEKRISVESLASVETVTGMSIAISRMSCSGIEK